jgi:hypothetical protein
LICSSGPRRKAILVESQVAQGILWQRQGVWVHMCVCLLSLPLLIKLSPHQVPVAPACNPSIVKISHVGKATSVQRLCHRQHCTGEGVAGKVLLVPVSLSHGKGTHKWRNVQCWTSRWLWAALWPLSSTVLLPQCRGPFPGTVILSRPLFTITVRWR